MMDPRNALYQVHRKQPGIDRFTTIHIPCVLSHWNGWSFDLLPTVCSYFYINQMSDPVCPFFALMRPQGTTFGTFLLDILPPFGSINASFLLCSALVASVAKRSILVAERICSRHQGGEQNGSVSYTHGRVTWSSPYMYLK